MKPFVRFASICPLAVVWAAGCAIYVRPPVGLTDPMRAFIADYGYHASLVLVRPDGRLAEYAYGEWEWFARGRDEWYRAAPTVMWPTRGALGTRDFDGPATADRVREKLRIGKVHGIRVERTRAAALLGELDRTFRENAGEQVYNPAVGLTFVPHPDDYWLLYQCNTMITSWLGKLGCQVYGCALLAEFVVERTER